MKKELLSLRPSDVLTTNKLARDIDLTLELAESLLADLVNEGMLNVILVASCINEDYSHSQMFFSFEEFYSAKSNMKCPDCGESMDFKNVKIGFRRGNY